MSASKFGQISSFPRNLTEILKAVTNTTLGVVMSRTSRSQAERALYETSMEPGQRLDSGFSVLKTRELPKTMEDETASDTLEKHYSINEISDLWGLSQKLSAGSSNMSLVS